jgi:BolA protein
MAGRIESKLGALNPLLVVVEDESAAHRGHGGWREGGETHFKVTVVSADFVGMNRVARQRRVYKLLEAEFADGLHALALTALSPEEAS